MVTKELVKSEVLRTCECVHCHTMLVEEAYSQWIGFDSLEGENMSQEELGRLKQDMITDNLAWQAEADKAWELRMGEFLLAHASCGLPIMTEEVRIEAEKLHTQQTPPEVKVTEEKQTTQSQNISQEDTKMADQKEENTNATPKTNMFKRGWNWTVNNVGTVVAIGVGVLTGVTIGVGIENKTNIGAKVGMQANVPAAGSKKKP